MDLSDVSSSRAIQYTVLGAIRIPIHCDTLWYLMVRRVTMETEHKDDHV